MEEQILRVVCGLRGQAGALGGLKMYDLVITNERLVGVVRADLTGAMVAGALGGAIGGALAGSSVARKLKTTPYYAPESLHGWSARDKAGFDLPYASIKKMKIGGLVMRNLHIAGGGKKYQIEFTKAAWEELRPLIAPRAPPGSQL